MNELPRVKWDEPDYTNEIDEIFKNIGVQDITFNGRIIDTVDDMKQEMLDHPHCNTILGLLKEYHKLSFRGDNEAWDKIEHISLVLLQLESPILITIGK